MFKFSEYFKNYNVSFYHYKKDTCSKCDEFNDKLKSSMPPQEVENIGELKSKHLANANFARQKLRNATTHDNCLVITFDLQKVQPIPYINTSEAY